MHRYHDACGRCHVLGYDEMIVEETIKIHIKTHEELVGDMVKQMINEIDQNILDNLRSFMAEQNRKTAHRRDSGWVVRPQMGHVEYPIIMHSPYFF